MGVVWEKPSERRQGLATPELMKEAAEWACRGGRASRLVVVFDQFEEALILQEETSQEFAALRDVFKVLTREPRLDVRAPIGGRILDLL